MTAHLSNDEFLIKLSDLFDGNRTKNQGSVFLTQKRMTNSISPDTFPSQTDILSFPDVTPTKPLSLLVRATNGKHESKIKISTVVTVDYLESFFARYADICKAGMSGLKKRDRSKAKARQKAKKKAGPQGEEKK